MIETKHPTVLEASQLSKQYNKVTVLDIDKLTLDKGETVGLIGNNGAGKTTFFRLVLDLIEASGGEVKLFGKSVVRSEHWKSKTGAFVDESFLIDYLTPEEYFSFLAGLHGFDKAALEAFKEHWEYLFNDEILGKRKKYIRDLSKGNQKKVGIAAAFMHSPELILLDEPFANLDPTSQIRLKRILLEQSEVHGSTTFISSHDLNHVTEVCKRTVIMEKGKIIRDFHTSADTLKELESYFAV
jgi:ABC-2 type transport system ATP-binding protein